MPETPVRRPAAVLVMADYMGTLTATRSLGREGIPVEVADWRRVGPARVSRFTTRNLTCPWLVGEPDRFLEWLLASGAKDPGRVLLPASDCVAWIAARHQEALRRHYRLYLPGFEAIHTLLDKQRLTDACTRAGIATIPCWSPGEGETFTRLPDGLSFPLIAKPRSQVLLQPHHKGLVIRSLAELRPRYAELRRATRHGAMITREFPEVQLPMLQEYVGEGAQPVYSISGFVDATGRRRITTASRKVMQFPRRAGIGLCFEDAPVNPDLESQVLALCREVGFHGVFEAEFMESDGAWRLIDFNPRFFGQMGFDVARGVPLPLLAYHGALGDEAAMDRLLDEARANRTDASRPRAYCNSIQLRSYLGVRRLGGRAGWEESAAWRRWRDANRGALVDATVDADDPRPSRVVAFQVFEDVVRNPIYWLNVAREG